MPHISLYVRKLKELRYFPCGDRPVVKHSQYVVLPMGLETHTACLSNSFLIIIILFMQITSRTKGYIQLTFKWWILSENVLSCQSYKLTFFLFKMYLFMHIYIYMNIIITVDSGQN